MQPVLCSVCCPVHYWWNNYTCDVSMLWWQTWYHSRGTNGMNLTLPQAHLMIRCRDVRHGTGYSVLRNMYTCMPPYVTWAYVHVTFDGDHQIVHMYMYMYTIWRSPSNVSYCTWQACTANYILTLLSHWSTTTLPPVVAVMSPWIAINSVQIACSL